MNGRVDIYISTCVAFTGQKKGHGAFSAVLVCDSKVLPISSPVSYSSDFNALFFAVIHSLTLLKKEGLVIVVHVRNKSFCEAMSRLNSLPHIEYSGYNFLMLIQSLVSKQESFFVEWLENDDNAYLQIAKRHAQALAESFWKIFSFNPPVISQRPQTESLFG